MQLQKIKLRKELLYQSVWDTLERGDFQAAVHKYKVFQDDEGGLRYFVIVDLQYPKDSPNGDLSDLGGPQKLAQIEEAIRIDAKRAHGAVISGVYWKAVCRENLGNSISRSIGQRIDTSPLQGSCPDDCLIGRHEYSKPRGCGESCAPTAPVQLDSIGAG